MHFTTLIIHFLDGVASWEVDREKEEEEEEEEGE